MTASSVVAGHIAPPRQGATALVRGQPHVPGARPLTRDAFEGYIGA